MVNVNILHTAIWKLAATYEYESACPVCSSGRTLDYSAHGIISKVFAVDMLTAERA